MRRRITEILAWLIMLTATALHAQEEAVVDLVLPAQTRALETLAAQLALGGAFQLKTHYGSLPPPEERGNILLVVSDALLPLLESTSYDAKFALYVNAANYQSVAAQLSNSSALYSDQPLARQLALIRAIFDQRSIRLGMAYRQAHYREALLEAVGDDPALTLNLQEVDDSSSQTINRIIQHCQVLLATPEEALYNPSTIRSILLSGYRHRTLIIGPSEAFVDAGALASVISEPQDYSNELLAMLAKFLRSGVIPPPRYPSSFAVKVNHNVARSLGLALPTEDELLRQIKEQQP